MARFRRMGRAIASSLVLASIAGCMSGHTWAGNTNNTDPNRPPSEHPSVQHSSLSDMNPEVSAAQTRFAFNLLAQVAPQANGENLMISPSSVAIALSMLYNGASGDTQQAMTEALALQEVTIDDLNSSNAILKQQLETADPNVRVAIANSLWMRDSFPVNSGFLETNQDYYDAEVSAIDFDNPAAVNTINDWVSRNTEGKIPTILDNINPDDVMFLINAIYFNGAWSAPFNPRETMDRLFYTPDGTSSDSPFMSQRGSYQYLANDQFQAIHLPYGDSQQMSMVVMLPSESSTLPELLSSLSSDQWESWMEQFRRQEGMIQLPRFTSDYSVSLNETLKAMGMAVAFSPSEADFAGISPEQIYVSDVKHKTYIDVNEQGTEAAAATSIGVTTTSMPIDPPFFMVCDRPFFYAIQDNETGTILFMGTVVNPN
ncbi:MAG: serpin family protein [Kaiparowitsia implicata GSE-PSE-MK54-09C]|nr:serpin family protein [Kaiparowitsia implicata GSE-PSE-MK54-09C]